MAKGPKVSHPEYLDLNSDEDDLLGDDYLLVDKASYENDLASNHANQDETNDNDKEKIESLTKELNTLKLALLEICPRGNNKSIIIIFPCS